MLSAKEAAALIPSEKEFINLQVENNLKTLDQTVRGISVRKHRQYQFVMWKPVAVKIIKELKSLGYKVTSSSQKPKNPEDAETVAIIIEW